MPTGHTKEPWRPAEGGLCGPDGSPGRYARTSTDVVIHSGGTLEEGRANIKRIVACVNAMTGIKDPAAFVRQAHHDSFAIFYFEQQGGITLPQVLDILSVLEAAEETLQRVGCQFSFCDGPDTEPEDMKTCAVCRSLRDIRAVLPLATKG